MNSSPKTYPKGVRFKPLEEELLSYYLEEKNQGKDSQITIIPEIHVLKHEPHELPALVSTGVPFGEREWFNPRDRQWHFFSPCDYMSGKSTRSKRKTQQGYWSITGADRGIMSKDSKAEIGRKRIMTFYLRGKPKARYRTNWVLHEYYLTEAHSDPPKQKGGFVLCLLKYKSGKKKKDKSGHEQNAPICDEAEPDSGSCSMPSNVQTQAAAKGMNTEAEENQLASKEPCSGGYHITPSALEIQAASNAMIAEAEEFLAYKELVDALRIPNGNEDAFNCWQTSSCLIDKNQHSNCVEGQPDSYNSSHSDMIEELFDEPENLDSLFPQPHPHPPQDYRPSTQQSQISTSPTGNVSYGTIVHDDECRKRNYPFGDKDPSLTKKNNISTKDYDEPVNSTSSNSENQATQWILEGHSQPEENLGLGFDSFQPQDYDSALSSICGGPGDFSDYNNLIGLDDLLSSFEDTICSLAKSSEKIIDGGSGVSSDRNTEVVHGSVKDHSALAIGAEQRSNIPNGESSDHQSWLLEQIVCNYYVLRGHAKHQYPIMVSNMGGAPRKNPTAKQHHKPRSVKLQRHYIAVYLPQKKLKPSPGSRQQFKAGSNIKGSFILLDASPFNPKSISFGYKS